MKKKIYVTGAAGMVGSRFIELYSDRYSFLTPGIDKLDILDARKIQDYISENNPDAIINFAAFTDVTGAETQRYDKKGLCYRVNVEGVDNLTKAIKGNNKIQFIQISTDMVFCGCSEDKGPYSEDHDPETDINRLTWYGFTKMLGEKKFTENLDDRGSIVRLIYPVRSKFKEKQDYIRGPLDLFKKGKLYPLFDDQKINITFIDEACELLDILLTEDHKGIFHAGSRDLTTPYELLTHVIRKIIDKNATLPKTSLEQFISEADIPSFRYPLYGGLEVKLTEKKTGIVFSTWKEIVDKLVLQGLN